MTGFVPDMLMTRSLISVRHALLAALVLSVMSGCASIQQAVDKVRGEDEPVVEPETPAAPPPVAPAKSPPNPAPKPAVRPRPAPQEPARTAPAPVQPTPAETAPADVPGPAWLKRCQSVQVAGGIVRCDADALLAQPSPTVQVFTRDPARAVAGQIRLRSGLPKVYRFYVVP